MDVASLSFWGIMSLASLAGGILAFPVNWWLVKNKLKHGMGTERALGKGGSAEGRQMNMPGMNKSIVSEHFGDTLAPSQIANTRMSTMNMESKVPIRSKVLVALLSVFILAIGIGVAYYFGNMSMRPHGEMEKMEMQK